VSGVAIRNVRAVSRGARMIDDSAEAINVIINVALGEDTVKISSVSDDALPISGKPIIADKRLRRKVLSVGRRSEYMNVAFVAFHTEVGPLVVHRREMTSINEAGFLICRRCFGVGGCWMYPARSVI
jgi:hypothetical protein